MLVTGLDRVLADPKNLTKDWGNYAIVTHSCSVSKTYIPCAQALSAATDNQNSANLICVYGPQHGYWQCEPYNMFETADGEIHGLGLKKQTFPLYSLYGKQRQPDENHLKNVQSLVIDLPDIGCRVYTYMTTLAGCLRVAARTGKKVIVLDRPNPLGLSHFNEKRGCYDNVEGNVIDQTPELESFVGWFKIPLRHGLTLGELGLLFLAQENLKVDYTVVTCDGLIRKQVYSSNEGQLPRMASPNMPGPRTMSFFPVGVSLEGTNISEGRGTTSPFQAIGAPFLDSNVLCKSLEESFGQLGISNQSICWRAHSFMPRFDKFSEKICHGVFLESPMDMGFPVFSAAIGLLAGLSLAAGNKLLWREKGYEYNSVAEPLDLILGWKDWRLCLENLRSHSKGDTNTLDGTWNELRGLMFKAEEQAQAFARDVHSIPGRLLYFEAHP